MNKKKRVLMFIPSIQKGGGAEKVAVDLGNELIEKGYDVSMLLIHDYLEEYQFKGKHIRMGIDKSFGSKIGSVLNIAQYIGELSSHYDVIISHMERANIILGLSKRMKFFAAGTIGVNHNHKYYKKFGFKQLVKKTYPYLDKIVSVSEGVEQDFYNHFNKVINQEDLKYIHNMFDLEKIKELSLKEIPEGDEYMFNNKYTLITIGRFHEQKNPLGLIKAFVNVPKRYNLIMLGDGPLLDESRRLAVKLGVYDRVYMPGRIDNVFPYLKRSDFFVLNSRWEGFGLVIVEAMACGLYPIVVDCKSGPREIISNYLNGNLEVQNENYECTTIGALVKDNLNYILKHSRIFFGKMNDIKDLKDIESRVKDFDKKNIIKEWIDIINEV